MGDVIMMVQAVRNVIEQNPEVEITLVTRPSFAVFFGTHPRLYFHDVDLNGRHKGLMGLRKLGNELKKQEFDYFLDLHDVLRSKIIRKTLLFTKTKVFKINKARKEKEDVIIKKSPLRKLKHTIERYGDVFKMADCTFSENGVFHLELPAQKLVENSKKTIGIAPFAAHESKSWGVDAVSELIVLIQKKYDCNILLFGGGKLEVDAIQEMVNKFNNVHSVAGKYALETEMKIMASCDMFLAMDSSNMHLADLLGLKVFSLWFATHPYLGFAPWSNQENCIQPSQEKLSCRPVSVYGKIKTKAQADCVAEAKNLITPTLVLQKLSPHLESQ